MKMSHNRWPVLAVVATLSVAGCSGGDESDDDAPALNGSSNGGEQTELADADGDTIADEHEGKGSAVDSDQDGILDYLDSDSDSDGIDDSLEAGDGSTLTKPIDSDGDGTADFRDGDSDDNGIHDEVEGTGDLDGDGVGDWADLDNDGDAASDGDEIVGASADCDGDQQVDPLGGPDAPADCDGDGSPNYLDADADGDTIADEQEAAARDSDGDGFLDRYDLDADNDRFTDAQEAGDEDLATAPVDTDEDGTPDYRDPDADGDGVSDLQEHELGTLPTEPDSDQDGASDLVELAAGTDPLDPKDNPQAHGDFVFLEPYQDAPDPTDDRLDFSTSFQKVDLYILEDVSGSMGSEIGAIKKNLVTMIDAITCGPSQQPSQQDFCIPDLETGAGRFGMGGEVWAHLKDISPDHAATQAALPETASGGSEQHLQAMAGATSGSCGSSISGRVGTACFRPDSLGLIMLVSDEDFHEDALWNTPQQSQTYQAMADLGIRVVGVTGNGGEVPSLQQDLQGMMSVNPAHQLVPTISSVPATPQCQTLGGNPFFNGRAIVSGPDEQAADALTCAVQAVTAYLPQTVYTSLVNDPSNQDQQSNPVDAVDAFVDYVEVFQDSSGECSMGNQVVDSNSDGYPDAYVGILPGTPVCWKLHVKQNDTVQPAEQSPQMFLATVEVRGEGDTLLDQRDVYFLVPPLPAEIPPLR